MASSASTTTASITHSEYGKLPDGRIVEEYILTNTTGTTVHILTKGCILSKIYTVDNKGASGDIVLGYNELSQWPPNFNTITGRYANRIEKGKFTIDNESYELECNNNGVNHLHGGSNSISTKLFTVLNSNITNNGCALLLQYISPDRENQYPGELTININIILTNSSNSLILDMQSTTNQSTIVNLCNHNFWNLNAENQNNNNSTNIIDNSTILNHQLQLYCHSYTPVNNELIPTGEIRSVLTEQESQFNFTNNNTNNTTINSQLQLFQSRDANIIVSGDESKSATAGGFDHNFIINTVDGKLSEDLYSKLIPIDLLNKPINTANTSTELLLKPAAKLIESNSGRTLSIYTTAPGIQFYSMNFTNPNTNIGKYNHRYIKHSALCLETQNYPNSPNIKHFPSPILKPNQLYRHIAVHQFGVIKS